MKGRIVYDADKVRIKGEKAEKGFFNIFSPKSKPAKKLDVFDPHGNHIGTATQTRNHGDSDPRAKGIFEYKIVLFVIIPIVLYISYNLLPVLFEDVYCLPFYIG